MEKACILATLAINFILSSMNLSCIWEVNRGGGGRLKSHKMSYRIHSMCSCEANIKLQMCNLCINFFPYCWNLQRCLPSSNKSVAFIILCILRLATNSYRPGVKEVILNNKYVHYSNLPYVAETSNTHFAIYK